ncbi:hypothetical protein L207DRAFT_445284, partial [Hyaloscypha variabilis F]
LSIVAVHGLEANPDQAWIGNAKYGHINWLADKGMLPSKLPHSRIMAFNYDSKRLLESPKQQLSAIAMQLLAILDDMRREVHKTAYGSMLWKELIVDEMSASIDGHPTVPLPTDHMKMNKFSGTDDTSYNIVSRYIVNMASQALEKVQGRLNPIPQEYLRFLYSLLLTNPPDDLARIRKAKGKRVEGTCEWLLVHREYASWLVQENQQLLWLSGGPGIGKTMISIFLVEELSKMIEQSPRVILAYYFCDGKDEKRNTATAILRGLLLQLLRQRTIAFKHILDVYHQLGDRIFDDFLVLWGVFLEILKDPDTGEVYCVVDALDECEENSRFIFLTHFKQLFGASQEREKKIPVKFIVTSRPEKDIEKSLSGTSPAIQKLQIDSGRINDDLSRFIDSRVDEISKQKAYSSKLAQTVKDALMAKAGGTFLYTSLALDDISEAYAYETVKKLHELPSNIYEMYDRILTQIDSDDLEKARSILSWVAVAARPLTPIELAMARILDSDEGEWTGQMTLAADLQGQVDDFRLCKSLLVLQVDTNTITFLHQSVKDYLLSQHLQTNKGRISQYHIDEDQMNFRIAKACLKYLCLDRFKCGPKFPPSSVEFAAHLQSNAFLEYAAYNWPDHALRTAVPLDDVYNLAADFFRDDSKPRSACTGLYWAAGNGHTQIAKLLLEKKANVNAEGGQYGNALQAASHGGHELIVKLLLDWGANVDAEGGKYGSALQAASRGGHELIVRLLLEKGANVHARGGKYGNALQAASRGGRQRSRQEQIVKLLLEKGADVDAQGGKYGNSLQAASYGGRDLIAKLLLDSSADLQAKDGHGWTALHRAAGVGSKAVVSLLLERGADIEAKDDKGQTALAWAAKGKHEAVEQLLLENGALVSPLRASPKLKQEMASDDGKDSGFKFRSTIVYFYSEEGHQFQHGSVDELLYENLGLEAIKGRYKNCPPSLPKFRWVHLPANNVRHQSTECPK